MLNSVESSRITAIRKYFLGCLLMKTTINLQISYTPTEEILDKNGLYDQE
jgi:hypothetical protein